MNGRLAQFNGYRGVNVTVMGLGTFSGGVSVVRFLAERGACVTVTDLRTEDQLQESLSELKDLSLRGLYCGSNPREAFRDAQLIIRNPAVKPGSVVLEECRRRGVIVSSEIELLLHHARGKVIGVTGSNGKSTTASLIHHLLVHGGTSGTGNIRLGGNIGRSLLPCVSEMTVDDTLVLELSSFQLELLRDSGICPDVAVLTGFTPNHLDWHGTMENYRAAKQILFRRQRSSDWAVLPGNDDANDSRLWQPRGHILRFGTSDTGEDGVFLDGGAVVVRRGSREDAFRTATRSNLRGEHNERNTAAALCAAWAAGVDPHHAISSLSTFRPLPHRLERVVEVGGRVFYNDSNSTTPESTIAALKSFSRPIVVLVGGADKGVDVAELTAAIRRYATAAVLMGDTGPSLARHLCDGPLPAEDGRLRRVVVASTFQEAFRHAVALADSGSIVLLSPGFASFGWFRDYRDRGDQFVDLARSWKPVDTVSGEA
ncbi:MAG: UDP-N-acetylmuramoyl-L-alanine--D-glutamate ligase [Planctomycetaceae bacterium]|nr:UDP-N-acetylmuramoyl-L-alanine--D-glutamate ligase [Planctomycetaceae bacterium]